jgi:energy-coupling factor transporter ATP-binding protein EcfA2
VSMADLLSVRAASLSPPHKLPRGIIGEFVKFCSKSGYEFGAHGALARRLFLSLEAKPFVILTGNSGSGKSKLAQLFALWAAGTNGYGFVAVGADWTDNRNVLGFVNPFKTVSDKNPTPLFQSTAILELLRSAKKDWDKNGEKGKASPWFLILDEMNLSHVERYFSDFLAHMEAPEEPLIIHHEKECEIVSSATGSEPLDPKISIPPNFFVIGTVNVDETTYMFSPKVLDRANVIEFKLADDALVKAQSVAPSALPRLERPLASGFLKAALNARDCKLTCPATGGNAKNLESYKASILEVFQILQQRDMEFGFRVQKEMIAYALADFHLHSIVTKGSKILWDWRRCFDEQLMQKVLPKLHGDELKIGPILSALLRYCGQENNALAEALVETENPNTFIPSKLTFKKLRELDTSAPDPAWVRFPLSYAKLYRMKRTLDRDQFVSYIA